jgi:hypothetical protein
MSLLYKALQDKHTEIVIHLLEHGAYVNLCDGEIFTMFYTDEVKHLVEHYWFKFLYLQFTCSTTGTTL